LMGHKVEKSCSGDCKVLPSPNLSTPRIVTGLALVIIDEGDGDDPPILGHRPALLGRARFAYE
jgi:hypothetical protein